MTLSGKKVLVTRPVHQASDFVRAIEANGGLAVVFPTIEILPPSSWDACDRALENLYMYNGLIFTSTNGVNFFFQRLTERGISLNSLTSKTIYVVGEKTGKAIEEHGLKVTVMPEKFTAADLSRKLESEDLRGKTFLFPRGNLGKDMLQDNLKLLGANVDSVIVYQTVRPHQTKIDEVRAMLLNGDIDVTTFTSPSTFNNFAALFSKPELIDIFKKTRIAVIGPVTATAITSAGFEPDITVRESTIAALTQAIIDFYRSIGD